jgi:hypothetical protein
MHEGQAKAGETGFWREIKLPACSLTEWGLGIVPSKAGMRQTTYAPAQFFIAIKLIRLSCVSYNGVAGVHQLAFEQARGVETQAACALPPAACIRRDDAYSPLMCQPEPEP